ncbi:hypothetical protein NDU88_001539 [Pleurodeles waltl]|uniref:Uncharacterized protein n=1 Tax=Pleurodeles waltl TaxID=8319 RepID=A0AAV7WM95_PLEWA|nr:hypothetical protein NDU88_001539 [Pleurodeles waltl]
MMVWVDGIGIADSGIVDGGVVKGIFVDEEIFVNGIRTLMAEVIVVVADNGLFDETVVTIAVVAVGSTINYEDLVDNGFV